jgi:hypothetical protein
MSSGNMRSQGSNSRASDSDTMTEDQVDALWVLVCPTLDLLASHVIPSVVRAPLLVRGSSSGGSLHHCSFAFV